ncbi:sister chromatid cohesion 1 protein 2-like [Phragmites australis]|uniref:sister chromatid cohesion 1 protein 2-like n=1 Tax=Phragmites australis TaxID=29695 RepID=UPI002D78DD65|nr:sister chromatid cohesion 1 protein 2-like [Phragmites australis]
MFYSKVLLTKKGALGTVWVAAVCGEAALSREQVARTDIVASVDKILSDVETPHRILALLLLGIVRIYSKKVEYIYHGCNQLFRSFQPRHCAEPSMPTGRSMHGVLKQVKKAVRAGRSVVAQQDTSKVKKAVHAAITTEISGPISSEGLSFRLETEVIVQSSVVIRETLVPTDLSNFTIPKRFELDSFDLEIAEDTDNDSEDHHQLAHQDILLEDERHHAAYSYESYQRATSSYGVDSTCFMPEYIALPPEVIGAISEVNNILDLSTKGDIPEREDQNADSAWFTPVKDILPPEMLDIVAEVNDPSNKGKMGDKSIREVDMDEDMGSACSIPLPENREGQQSDNVLQNMTCAGLSANYPSIEESENGSLQGKSNTGPPVGGFPEHDIEEHESLEPPAVGCKINDLSPSTPEPLLEGVPGPPSSPRFRVRTPAKIEMCQITRKRRRGLYNKDYLPTDRENKRRVRRRLMWSLYDEDIVLSNEMLKKAIEDTKDLVHQRRKAPHTYLEIWKVEKIGCLLDTFMDPLIPYQTSVHLAHITAPEAPESSRGESVKARKCLSYKRSESSHSCKDAGNTERESILDEPRKRELDEPTDFESPAGCYTEKRHLQDDVCECHDAMTKENDTQVKGDEPSSVVPSKKGPHESENHIPLHNEALYAALDNIDEDIPMDEEHTRGEGFLSSTRTRKIARCFHELFLHQNRKQGTKSVSLNQALEGKKRKTSARFFYETLILKSHGLIEVNQEQPYEDIMLSPTPQLEAEVGRSGN